MNRTPKTKRTANAMEILKRRLAGDAELRELLNEARLNARIARLIHAARTRAGLTQAQLAARIGTRQPVIARLEDADYEGHSLGMLRRIAAALDRRLEVRFLRAKAVSRA